MTHDRALQRFPPWGIAALAALAAAVKLLSSRVAEGNCASATSACTITAHPLVMTASSWVGVTAAGATVVAVIVLYWSRRQHALYVAWVGLLVVVCSNGWTNP